MKTDAAGCLSIREMAHGEQAFLVALAVDTFQDVSIARNITDRHGHLNTHPWTDHKADQVLADIDSSEVVLVAQIDSTLAAFATLRYDTKYSTGTLGHLAVARDFQGRGVGRAMVRAVLDRFRRDGLRYARIEALEQNARARALYAAEGFQEVARQVVFFRPL